MYVIQTLMLYIMCAQLLSRVQLSDPIDSRLLGSYVDGISQERILEWVAISFSRGSYQSRDRTHVSCIAGRFFICEPSWKDKFIERWIGVCFVENIRVHAGEGTK